MPRSAATLIAILLVPMMAAAQSNSVRLRALGGAGLFAPGSLNTITDVAGVQVGHRTLVEGDSVRTGVTAILPQKGDLFGEKVPAAVHVGNGFGKAAGVLQVQELATDAPISPRNLERMAKRAMLGLARTGSYASNGSGDFVIAFSPQNRRTGAAAPRPDSLLPNDQMSPLVLATVEAVEEAVYNALTAATTVTSRDGHAQEALPLDRLRTILREAGRIETN